jgi:hypothetical protein
LFLTIGELKEISQGVYFSFGDEPIEKREDYEVTDVRWHTKCERQATAEAITITVITVLK